MNGSVADVLCLHHGQGFIVQFCRRLRGADGRAFQAEVAVEVCGGSPRRAESMFGWRRKSVQKGLIEQEYHLELQPHFARRGRLDCEFQSPTLASVATEVLDAQSQADPKFQTNVLFTRATGNFSPLILGVASGPRGNEATFRSRLSASDESLGVSTTAPTSRVIVRNSRDT